MVCMLWIIPRFATLIAPYSIIQNICWRSILSPAYLYTVFYRCFVQRESRMTNVHTYWCIAAQSTTIYSTSIRSIIREVWILSITRIASDYFNFEAFEIELLNLETRSKKNDIHFFKKIIKFLYYYLIYRSIVLRILNVNNNFTFFKLTEF